MNAATKQDIENLASMVANGFDLMEQKFASLEKEITDLRSEVKSIRTELERIPDDIDATYSNALNDLLDRVSKLESRLATVEAQQ